MEKLALLIGVTEHGPGLNPLPGAVKAVEAIQQVLQSPGIGGFDEVKPLLNPNPPAMREAIETLFSDRTKNDLVLLFFSGHIVRDDNGKLYFATSIACKNPRPELIKVSTIPLSFLRELMSDSPSQRQVIILDCCFSSLSEPQIKVTDEDTAQIKAQLSGNGRIILTSFTSTPNFFELEGFDHSVYSRYLLEGIRTGAADLDTDGWISVNDLHEYARNKAQVASPAVKPEFFCVEDGYKILLAKAPLDDPKLNYRKEVENWVKRGEISEAGRYILDKLAESLQLTFEDCAVIEAEVIKPYQEYQGKLQQYEREFTKAIRQHRPLTLQGREELRGLQQVLGLRDEDVTPLEELITWKLSSISQADDDTSELTQSDSENRLNSLPFTPSAVLPEDVQIPAVQPPNPTQLVNFSSSLAGSQSSPASVSTFPKKSLLWIGIGGGLAAVAVAIGMSSRNAVPPPTNVADTLSSSPTPSPKPSPTATPSDKRPSPSPSPSPIATPESKDCLVFVNGNLRSKPASFQDNVVALLREPLRVTGKQTEGGWVEVKLPEGKRAWAHRDIIANDEEMDACISRKRIKIKIVEDIPPPAPSPSPKLE